MQIVTPNGTAIAPNKDYDLVSTTTLTNKGGEFLQIHYSYSYKGNMPHTHKSQINTNSITGATNIKRFNKPTGAPDIGYADKLIKDSKLRVRANRSNVGGYLYESIYDVQGRI